MTNPTQDPTWTTTTFTRPPRFRVQWKQNAKGIITWSEGTIDDCTSIEQVMDLSEKFLASLMRAYPREAAP